MRQGKPDVRIKFTGKAKLVKRNQKIQALSHAKTPEGRKAYKDMFTFRIGRVKVNTTGFFEPSGKSPIRCK